MARVGRGGEPVVTRMNDGPKTRRVRAVSKSADVLPSRYQTFVLASDAPTAVHHVGGWYYDHVARGWPTSAALLDGSGVRAIRILGAITKTIDEVIDACEPTRANAIAVDSVLYGNDTRVRRFVDRVSTGPFNRVLVWGAGDVTQGRAIGFAPAEHLLSDAARAFKGCARTALGLEVERHMDVVERFRLSGGQWPIDGTSEPRM